MECVAEVDNRKLSHPVGGQNVLPAGRKQRRLNLCAGSSSVQPLSSSPKLHRRDCRMVSQTNSKKIISLVE
ncbi:hypothetical protein T10_6430 [Trichinella papuae]|uniref:Uncharacterized protein n=1 Tax=Trichinella papuae TaxID=268474 RepID=A0A0V1M7A1_9BILA|nr:hypothetical protein T10_6430 [Trichinella papuae]